MGIKCPKYQSEIVDDSRFCSKCGTPIQFSEEVLFSHTRTVLKPMDTLPPGTKLVDKYEIECVSTTLAISGFQSFID